MKLHTYLSEKTILPELKSREKNEAIAELAEVLRDHPAMGDFDAFLGAVFSREMEGTTGIGNGSAIPHARTDCVRDFVAALGLSAEGVDFQSVDGAPAHVVLLMGIPSAKIKAYLKLLAHLSLLLKQKDFVRKLLEAPSAASILATFAAHEE